MRQIILFSMIVALTSGAMSPGPVYRSAATVVNSSPVGKSHQIPVQQPAAEERESQGFQTVEQANPGSINNPGISSVNPTGAANPTAAGNNPQTFKIIYYPTTAQQGGYPAAYSPHSNTGVDFWTRYHVPDVLVGGGALALVAAGAYMLYGTKLTGFKARALRELSEMNAEDANNLAKGVLRALDRLYQLNAGE